jgi:hypothetical protein
MSGLIDAARAAAAGLSFGIRQIGRARGRRRLRNWLIPPTTPNNRRGPLWPGNGRLAIVPIPVPVPIRPPFSPSGRGTSRPQIDSTGWLYPTPATLDSSVLGAPVSPLHTWPRRVFIMVVATAAIVCLAVPAYSQCGSGCCGGCGGGPSFCSPGPCSPGPGCCCPPGGCGFGCSAGCGCRPSMFNFGLFGGGRCCSPCGTCGPCGPGCSPVCGGPCGGGCGSICGARCSPCCGSPCGGPCGCSPCGGGCCGGPACGLACSPCGPGACGIGCGPSCMPGCAGAPIPGGAGCCPTYETMPAVAPGGPNPALGPAEPIPGVPSTTIPKRPALPPDDKGTRFERRPVGTSGTAAAVDVTDNSDSSATQSPRPEKRLIRQSASAGFHTRVLTAQRSRAVFGNRASQVSSIQRGEEELVIRD